MNNAVFIVVSLLACSLVLREAFRAKGAEPPHGRLLRRLFGLALLQAALIAVIYWALSAALGKAPYTERGTVFAVSLDLLQRLARFAALLLIFRGWVRLVRPRVPRWLIVATFGCIFAGGTWYPLISLAGILLCLIVAGRARWTEQVTGLARLYTFLGALLCILLLLPVYQRPIVFEGGEETEMPGFGLSTTSNYELSGAPPAAVRIHAPVRALDSAILALGFLLWIQAIAAFYSLMAPRLHLRKLALRRRFAVTYALIILLPGLFSLAAALVILYMGVGAHKSSLAKSWLDETIDRNVSIAARLSGELREEGAAGATAATAATAANTFTQDAFREWAGRMAEGRLYAWRRVASPATSPVETAPPPLYASPGLPAGLVSSPPFAAPDHDSAGGIVALDDRFYLVGVAARAAPDGSRDFLEVYTTLDSALMTDMERKISAGVVLSALPTYYVSSSGITGTSDSLWTERPFSIASTPAGADPAAPHGGGGFFGKRREISTSLLPAGEWLHYRGAEGRGAVSMKIVSTIGALLGEWFAPRTFFFTRGPAMLLLLVVLVLFATALRVVVGTGRGIVAGLLGDLGELNDGVGRLGEGDFDYKVPVRGRDEVAGLSEAFNRMGENLKQHQKDLLEKERLEADLAVAREIQRRLLPQEAPSTADLDVAGISVPSREVGGDLFYFLRLPANFLGVAIGDVSGKSVPAALLMSNVLAALKTEARHEARTDRSLSNMNDLVAEQVEPGRFVTFFYGVIDPSSMKMLYACAGHNPTLVMSADGKERWLEESGLPLGVLAGSAYEETETQLDPGDVLVLYSDGVTEAERPLPAGAEGEETEHIFFEEERLVEAVRANRHGTAGEILNGILTAVNEFTGGAPRSDDLTVVIVKVGRPADESGTTERS